MKIINQFSNWLETRWVAPAYSGWMLGLLAICFFGSAINTMAGWLYVLSGISFALLGMAAVLPKRSLKNISVHRHPIQPISAGDQLTVEVEIQNQTPQPKTLLQVQDLLPFVLGEPVKTAIEIIPPGESYKWVYYQQSQRRGIYRWQTLQLRTATPLGLFWSRRDRNLPATATVYPTVLPLTICPLIDEIGQENSLQSYSQDRRFQTATEGLTRSLRPYRQGDPTRLIHWRTSARYGELRVRELETITEGQELVICLDSAATWQNDDFEQAVIAAASLYFYATKQQLNVKLWTAFTGLAKGEGASPMLRKRIILETLAATNFQEELNAGDLPKCPIVWLTQNPLSLNSLPAGSRWVLWEPISSSQPQTPTPTFYPGLVIHPEEPLQLGLQKHLK